MPVRVMLVTVGELARIDILLRNLVNLVLWDTLVEENLASIDKVHIFRS